MESKSCCKVVLAGLKGVVVRKMCIGQVKPDVKKSYSKLDLESSTWAVSQRQQPRQAWKMLKPCGPLTQHDAIMDNNINNKSGRYRVKPGMTSLFNVSNLYSFIKLVCHPARFLCGVSRFYLGKVRKQAETIKGRGWCCRQQDKHDNLNLIGRNHKNAALYPVYRPYGMTNAAKGFTLIELLVVVLIIGILASIAIPQYQKAVERAKAMQAITLLKSLSQAYETYYFHNGVYASSFDELDIDFTSWTGSTAFMGATTDTKSNADWSLQIQNESGFVLLLVGRISGKYKGAFFQFQYSPFKVGLRCAERTSGANFLYDTSLPAGAYCEKIMHAAFTKENSYNRLYNL